MTAPNRLDQSSPEAAELIRDARALVAGVEKGISYVGVLFALTVAATIAAMKADLRIIAAVAALLAVVAFAAALLGILFRITLGDPPAPAAEAAPATPAPVAEPPATSSAATTGENPVILRK
ncbi:hypothetical protein GCM10027059_41980 [Myceligenerans halotolerans]